MNTTDNISVLIPAAHWPAIRQRARSAPFAAAVAKLYAETDRFMADALSVPDEPGGHYHHYFCPQHGIELEFDPRSPQAHRCPADGAVYSGEPYDAAWRWFVNNRLSQGTLRLAVRWQLEGNSIYAVQVADVLLGYADRYEDYGRVPRTNRNPGIATHQTLDEAVWVLPLAWGFDLIRSSLSATDIETITTKLFIPVAEFLVRRHSSSIHNFACWHNAAIATLGVVTGRRDLVEQAVNGEFGLERQLNDGVLADGLWFEGSFSYHFYALAAVIMQLKATQFFPEFDRRVHPAVHAMFAAPIRCAFPDGTLPATNDCWYFTGLIHDCCHGVPPAPAFYEIGYTWYGDDRFAQVLQRAYQQGPRDSLDTLLYGLESIPEAEMNPLASHHLPASGYAILRTETEEGHSSAERDSIYLLLKYGPHGGGHGHPDKLNLILYAHDQRLSVDLGTPGYGLALFESWYRRTVSHNTLTVDGCSQPPAKGHIVRYQGEGAYQIADAAVSWTDEPYEGVSMRRVLLARRSYFLDICIVTCDRPRQIDWIYHNQGELQTALAFDLFVDGAGAMDGYEHLTQARQAKTDDDLSLVWKAAGAGLRLFSAGDGAEIWTATSPGYPATEPRMTVINRRRCTETTFLSVFHPYGQTPSVHDVRWRGRRLLDQGWAGCTVHSDQGQDAWLIRLSAQGASPPTDALGEGADRVFEYCLA